MPQSKHSDSNSDLTPTGRGHMTRLWLLALLVLTALVSGGVLFAKFQLEALRTNVQAEIERRTGVFLDAESVRVDGLRGLRLRQLHMTVETDSGPTIDAYVPDALLLVSITDLLQGRVTMNRIQLDDAHIRLTRPRGNFWFTDELTDRSALTKPISFRAVGQNCSVEIERIVGDTSFRIESLDFDLNRLADSPHLIANLAGKLDENSESDFQVFARYSSLENFDLRVQGDELDSQRIAPFFPFIADHIASGTVQPSIRVSGYSRHTMVVGLELPFNAFVLTEEQDFPIPTQGLLTALASYDINSHELTLNTARTLSPEFEGQVEGTIQFAQDPPVVDLKLEVEHLAMEDIMAYATDAWLKKHGTLALEASDPYLFYLTFKGAITDTKIGVEAQLGAGTVHFSPSSPSLPEADLQFNLMSLSWSSDKTMPTGRLSLSDGSISHKPSGLLAEKISGTLLLSEDAIAFEPLVAQVAGNTVRGSLAYAIASEALSLDLSGDLAAVEELGFIANNPKLNIRGPVTIEKLSGNITPTRYELDTTMDMTRTQIDWEWWLGKKPGIGARIQDLHLEIEPGKTFMIAGTAALDTATIDATASLKHSGGKWALQQISAASPQLKMSTVDNVLQLPYAISGGSGQNAQLKWHRDADNPDTLLLNIAGVVDELALLPNGTNTPITGTNVRVNTHIIREGNLLTGTLDLSTDAANLPPFGTPWLLPLREKDDPSMITFPPMPRSWTYNLNADTIDYPPWSGTDFKGNAFNTLEKNGFNSFEADVAGGKVGGLFTATSADNVQHLNANWEKVPAKYLLEHLKLPEIFTGTMTGGITYDVDRDNTGTLRGTGYFDVLDGQFSADYLFAQFERQIEESSITLPPSMKFSHFAADIALEGDVVKTTNMLLESDAVTISGNGQFVVEGDMDYRLKMALPPATAKGIPALRTNFNLDGLKHSQNNLELAFHIFGPSFAPKMELEGLPSVGDTIVSGAVEVTSDVIKVVDLPRQILLDLFKIGGGIVGAGGKRPSTE